MNDPTPIYIDATMMYRWKHLAPVGIVRLERLIASHLRFVAGLGPVRFILWDDGYRLVTDIEEGMLDELLDPAQATSDPVEQPTSEVVPAEIMSTSRRVLPAVRRGAMRTMGRLPDHLRPFAEQAAWAGATFLVESGRYVRRRRDDRRATSPRSTGRSVTHRVDFSGGGDLVALGLGWEYLDHEEMYRLSREHGIRIHMPAFDLIPIDMPQMNAGQSHLVHRYYAEMAHYADTITSISEATTTALRAFYEHEQLPTPVLATNPLPGFELDELGASDPARRRHRLEGERFVLTVSTIEIRKNHLLLAKIWTECAKEGIDLPRLAIVGRVGWDVAELVRWIEHAPELQDHVEIFADVEDEELVRLYHDALFTVFPSRIEGWGLPITESLTCGKVCIHSTDPAQLEASQGLMPALHPDDYVSWKREIVRMSSDAEHRVSLEQVIRERYRPRTPSEYCEAYARIIAERRGATA
jgi:glycosyltransferase involved in cell wall biosynthesis